MRAPLRLFTRRSLRFRVTIVYVGTTIVLTLLLSIATLIAVRSVLQDGRVRSSSRQALFATLFAREFLASNPDPGELGLRLQIREQFDSMVVAGPEFYTTRLELTPSSVPTDLEALVERERVGYQITEVAGRRVLVFGTPLPPADTNMYLFFSMDDIDRTLSILLRAMALAGLAIVAGFGVFAYRIAGGILQPLRTMSEATRRMAEGLLETRVSATSPDEVGMLAESFNTMGEALKDMIDRERLFVAAVSHELRTPLATLGASAEVVAAHLDQLPPDAREAFSLVREDIAALGSLVQELLEISELDSGRAQIRAEEVDVGRLLAAMLRRRQKEAEITGEGPVIWSDKARIERILGNLVDNAFSHGEGRGVRIGLGGDDGRCIVTIADSGPGIPQSDLPHVFERFYRADRSRGRDRGGVGLGLAIARENALLLGGAIMVESEPGRGTTFRVVLPSAEGERP